MAPTLEQLQTRQGDIAKEADEIARSFDGGIPNAEQAEKLRSLDTEYVETETQLKAAEEAGELAARFRARMPVVREAPESDDPKVRSGAPDLYGASGETIDPGQIPVTPGELFVESEEYAGWMKNYPNGGPSKGNAQSEAMSLGMYRPYLGMTSATEKLRAQVLTPGKFDALTSSAKYRALITSADASAGHLVRPDYRGVLERIETRPLTIRDMVTVIPVTTDSIEYVKENTRASNAAPVAEATTIAAADGVKPEGGFTFTVASDTVRTIAEWVPATRRILSDAGQLRGMIDEYLNDDISLELEDQMVAGPGTGENFRGILNVVGIQTGGPPAGATTEVDLLRKARRQVQIGGRTNPTAVAINPIDLETIDLLKWGGATPSGYMAGGPFGAQGINRIWGMPVVESEAIPAGTALVGDFRRAILFDREDVTISVGTVNDDFIRNIVRVLGEMRAGFGVLRPAAFVAVDLVA